MTTGKVAPLIGALFSGLVLLGLSATANAERSVVILSQQCEYVLLGTGGRQVLIKVINGRTPQTGDTLTGTLKVKDFADLTNNRNQESMNVWVDMIDGNNRALSRYSQYCS